jgi:hypothetical protein
LALKNNRSLTNQCSEITASGKVLSRKMQNICKSRDDNVLLIRGFSLFWSEIFGNRMCQAWPKQLENEGIQAL